MTDADLAPAFDRAAQARQAIRNIIEDVRTGTTDLAGAFERGDADSLVGRCFAVKVFEAVPDIGKVRARRTMATLGIDEGLWLADVPPSTRQAVIDAFAEPASD